MFVLAYVVNPVCLFDRFLLLFVLFGQSGFIYLFAVWCVHAPRVPLFVLKYCHSHNIYSIGSRPCSRPKTVMRPAEESNQSHPSGAAGCGTCAVYQSECGPSPVPGCSFLLFSWCWRPSDQIRTTERGYSSCRGEEASKGVDRARATADGACGSG